MNAQKGFHNHFGEPSKFPNGPAIGTHHCLCFGLFQRSTPVIPSDGSKVERTKVRETLNHSNLSFRNMHGILEGSKIGPIVEKSDQTSLQGDKE